MEITHIIDEIKTESSGIVKVSYPFFENKKRINKFYADIAKSFAYGCAEMSGEIYGVLTTAEQYSGVLVSVCVSYRIFEKGEKIKEGTFCNVWDTDSEILMYKRKGIIRNTNVTLSKGEIVARKKHRYKK